MKIVTSVEDMKKVSREWRAAGRTIGLVPTMGYLHEGHLSLVREAGKRTSAVAVSIFVNPAQFGPTEDLGRYPRDLERDKTKLEKEGVAALFLPNEGMMYPEGYRTWVEVHELQNGLCGKTRPVHFRGVATVVLKLFNIVRPDQAFFGWKDAQQLVILKRMAADLDLDVKLEGRPIVREADGLAMSSRNSYLSVEERRAALVLQKALKAARRTVESGERRAAAVQSAMAGTVAGESLARLDYAAVVDLNTLQPLETVAGDVLIALAVYIGRTRLIDNVRLSSRGEWA